MQTMLTQQRQAFKTVFGEHKITPDFRAGVRAFRGPRFISWRLRLQNPGQLRKALNIGEELALQSGSEHVIATRQYGVIRYDFSLDKSCWMSYTRKQLMKPSALGVIDGATGQEMNIEWEDHKIYAGATRSGKSVAIQSALVAMAETYSPEDLDIMLGSVHAQADFMDDDEGVDFTRLPHLASDVVYRGDDIKHLIKQAWMIYKYREENNETQKNGRAKKLIVVIDEVNHDALLGLSPAKDDETLIHLQQLLQGAAKYNMRVWLGSQHPSQTSLPKMINNIGDRFVGKVDNAKTSALLTGLSGANAHMLSGYGDFYHVESGVVRFQVAQPIKGNGRFLPSGPMNPLPVMWQQNERIPTNDFVQDNGVGRPASIDWALLGRIFAVGLKLHRRPGSSMRKRWGVDPNKFNRHLTMFNNSPLRDFLDGFITERNHIIQGGMKQGA